MFASWELPSRSRLQNNLAGQRAGLAQRVLFLKAVGGRCLRQGKGSANGGVQLLIAQPAVHILGADSLLLRRRVEYREAEERHIARVKRSDRKGRLGLPAGYDDDPAPP